MPVLNQQMRDIIIDGYEKGLPIREIALLAGTSYECARTTASRLGLKHPYRHVNRTQMQAVSIQEARDRVSPQYANWLRAKQGAAQTLRGLE